jgi:capsular exopolysaccharide synthesis family protein
MAVDSLAVASRRPVKEPESTYLEVIWRRKLIIAAVTLVFAGATAAVSKTLPPVYSTSSSLLVAQSGEAQTFDAVQAAQVIARTYSDLLESPNVARLVANRLGGGETTRSVERAVTIEPVPETQLIRINAEDRRPRRAQAIADAYAAVFIARSDSLLGPTVKATVLLADRAPFPRQPSRPKPVLYTLFGTMLGLLAGLGLAFLRERFDIRLRTLDDIEAVFDIPVLTRVPRRGKSASSISAFSEAFRVLRTNLQFASPHGAPRTIAVTSSSESEGKTTTVAQLALATSGTGVNVVVVESDVHRPELQELFAPTDDGPLRPGLSNYFLGGASLDEIIHPTTLPTIKLVPSGPAVPSLSGLLESRRGFPAIEHLAAAGDLVLFDCPPLNLGADPATLAARVDGVILVVDLERATEKGVRQAIQRLEAVRARVLGFVLNRDRKVEGLEHYGYPLDESKPVSDRRARAGA